MHTISIQTGRPYEVLVGRGLLAGLGELTAQACPLATRAALVSDDTVAMLYGEAAAAALAGAGLSVSRFAFPHGEENKTLSTYGRLLSFLARERLTRTDCIVALGGGVTGDLAGFAAATYLRGVDFVQAPTTLLAAVDASVGGKTAVDLPEGKNLVGAFHQPALVVCDTGTFATLPEEALACGMAELLKHGVIADEALFDSLAAGRPADLAAAVARSVEIKGQIVAGDERDNGTRQCLNLGHTAGHAVELLSGLTIPHGEAVAIGMALVARAAHATGRCAADVPARIEAALARNGLPVRCPFDAHALAGAVLSDKKRRGDTVTLVIPEAIGRCALCPTPVGALEAFFASGLPQGGEASHGR